MRSLAVWDNAYSLDPAASPAGRVADKRSRFYRPLRRRLDFKKIRLGAIKIHGNGNANRLVPGYSKRDISDSEH
jgi:hypothetical protein